MDQENVPKELLHEICGKQRESGKVRKHLSWESFVFNIFEKAF